MSAHSPKACMTVYKNGIWIQSNDLKYFDKLMSAAPELLAACEEALKALRLAFKIIGSNCSSDETLEMMDNGIVGIKEAIAKAKGEK